MNLSNHPVPAARCFLYACMVPILHAVSPAPTILRPKTEFWRRRARRGIAPVPRLSVLSLSLRLVWPRAAPGCRSVPSLDSRRGIGARRQLLRCWGSRARVGAASPPVHPLSPLPTGSAWSIDRDPARARLATKRGTEQARSGGGAGSGGVDPWLRASRCQQHELTSDLRDSRQNPTSDMQSHASRTLRDGIRRHAIARTRHAAAAHAIRAVPVASLITPAALPSSLTRAFAVARHFSTASPGSKKDPSAAAPAVTPSTDAPASNSASPSTAAPASAPVSPAGSSAADALAEAAKAAQAIQAAHAERKQRQLQAEMARARLADPAAMKRRAQAHASSADFSGAGAHRLLWHRSLTKREISALFALLLANVWILFLAWQAEDATAANAKKAGRGTKANPAEPEDRSELQEVLDRHFTVSLENISEGRVYTLVTASLHHRSLLHAASNLALIMMCAPGVLAATSGMRVLAGLFCGASVAGWGAELAVWDILAPPVLEGREGFPLAKTTRAKLQPNRAPAATTTAAASSDAQPPAGAGSQQQPTPQQLRAVELRRQQLLASQSQSEGGPWSAGLGASPFALSLTSLWLLSYHRLPLGQSPMGKVIKVLAGLTALSDLACLAGFGSRHSPRDSSIVVHGVGALVGALVFLKFRRHAGAAAIVKEAEVAAAARYRGMAGTNAAAAAKKQQPAAASAAATPPSTAAPATASSAVPPSTAVATTPSASSSTALVDADAPAATAVLAQVLDSASPANAEMRSTPPRAHIGPRRPGQQTRGYATSAAAAPVMVSGHSGRAWVRRTQFGRIWRTNKQLHATAHPLYRRSR